MIGICFESKIVKYITLNSDFIYIYILPSRVCLPDQLCFSNSLETLFFQLFQTYILQSKHPSNSFPIVDGIKHILHRVCMVNNSCLKQAHWYSLKQVHWYSLKQVHWYGLKQVHWYSLKQVHWYSKQVQWYSKQVHLSMMHV